MEPLVLVPYPRRVSMAGATVVPTERTDTSDPTLPAEGYRVTVHPTGEVVVAAADEPGRFYADQTLAQLQRGSGGALPVGEIEDWPDLAVRGVMLDVSRDKVPTLDTLFALVDRLAEWKVNHLELYLEHTFAYRDHEDVWRHASPFTADDIRALQERCAARHIDLVPNQNCLGHMERWLQHERYRPLALRPEGFRFMGDRRGPSTLDPTNPASMALVRSLLAELLPNFDSHLVHVGLDEPWELDDERIDDYVAWIRQLRDAPELNGREMLMWGDILANHPDRAGDVPAGVTICEWGYEANHPFPERVARLTELGRPFVTCPGTSTWVSIVGRWANARENIAAAADAAVRFGGRGLLNTDWGDLGHLQYLPFSYPGFAYGAAVSWCLEANRDLDVARALDEHVFGDAAGVLGQVMLELGDAHRVLSTQLPNVSLLTAPIYLPKFDLSRVQVTADEFDDAASIVSSCLDRLAVASPACGDHEVVEREVRLAAELVLHAAGDATARLVDGDGTLPSIPAQRRADLARTLDGLVERHRACWLARNREGGLDDSCGRLRRLQRAYETGSVEGIPMYG